MPKIKMNVVLILCCLTAVVLPPSAGAIVVQNSAELVSAVAEANAGGDKNILLQDGVYTLEDMLWIGADGVTVSSLSGKRGAVIIQGAGMDGPVTHVFNVAGSHFAARHLTLRRVSQHAVQLQLDVDAVLLQDLHILDIGEQMVKAPYDPDDMTSTCDNGIMENCLLEYSAGIGPQWYIGGIDVHNGRNWIVRANIFKGIRSPNDAPAEHAIHFWTGSQDTLVERNLIINCDRGIGFGLGDRGHGGGIIRNNMIYHDATEGFADVGIGLESAADAQVYNNTIYQQHSYANAIEYRFTATTGVFIANNLCNKAIARRDGASATLENNLTNAQGNWFVDSSSGDLHLSSAIAAVVDRGAAIAGLNDDFDADSRPQGAAVDIGADESIRGTASNIFNTHLYADGNRTPTRTYEEDRVIIGHQGEPTTLSFRLSLYGDAAANMPLLVQVHEWGGDFAREEDLAGYVPTQYAFVMLYFQYQPSTGNTDDWWFGTRWAGECRPWAHDAIVAIVDEVLHGTLVPDRLTGVTVDPNRVYLFGTSIGGTGAWQLGVRHPELFAAMHAHSGFARFTPPVGPFQEQFELDIVGSAGEGIVIRAADGRYQPARDYTNLGWWLTQYRNPAWETPFIAITAGTEDAVVPAASGGDLMQPVLDAQKRGFFYHRHNGGHSEDCFVQMNWLWNFRKNQSFLAFTNRSGYGIEPDETVTVGDWSGYAQGGINDLYQHGWDPSSIVDRYDHYEVQLTGTGSADVTLRRLQTFQVAPGGLYQYWLDAKDDAGAIIQADQWGLLTAPQVPGGHRLIIEPADSDGDGLPDPWEQTHFGDLARDGTGDYDQDGLTDLDEYRSGTNPTARDSDADGMADGWEVAFGLQPLVDDAHEDRDKDGFSNLKEYLFRTDPTDESSQPRAFGPDFNRNLLADFTVWRPTNGGWYANDPQANSSFTKRWGAYGDIPFSGDFDGDGRSDPGVWRPSNGCWYILLSSRGYSQTAATLRQWGKKGDVPIPGDYDGDGRTDLAVWRPSTGTWHVISIGGSPIVLAQWGANGDVPVAMDYNGDGRTDLAVWRPSSGRWYVRSTTGELIASQRWGCNGDIAVPGDYDGDGRTDFGIWRPSAGVWLIQCRKDQRTITFRYGMNGDIPLTADYDGDNRADAAVWRPATGQWFIRLAGSDFTENLLANWGAMGDWPVSGCPVSAIQ